MMSGERLKLCSSDYASLAWPFLAARMRWCISGLCWKRLCSATLDLRQILYGVQVVEALPALERGEGLVSLRPVEELS